MLSRSINDDSSDWGTISRLSVALNTVFGRCIRKKRLNGIAFTFRIPPALCASEYPVESKAVGKRGTPVFL